MIFSSNLKRRMSIVKKCCGIKVATLFNFFCGVLMKDVLPVNLYINNLILAYSQTKGFHMEFFGLFFVYFFLMKDSVTKIFAKYKKI